MKKLFLASGVVNAICLIALTLFVGIQLPAFGMWFYRLQYEANETYARVDMEPEDLHEVTRHMIRYMQGRETDLQILTTVGGEERTFFSEIEIRHMEDVQDLFVVGLVVQNVLVVLFLLTLGLFIFRGREWVRYLFKSWQIGAAAVFLSLATLIALIAINWHHAFVIFHEIFFDNDYWILDARVDLLVNIVPYEFFIAISVLIGSFFALGLGVLFGGATLGLRRNRKDAE
ncbi:MAG: TIGR01906 family membrane protein [Oscillospiraceae bacterium]|nr:TIGR01906 family membrane protein [Oscillospiraceae bacterium]